MSIFVALSPAPGEKLKAAVSRAFPSSHFEISPGQIAITASGVTAQEVASKLGIDGSTGQVVVFASSGHWGWHRKDLWEWLAAKSSV